VPHFNDYNPSSFGWTASPHREHIVDYSFGGVAFVGGVHAATVKYWNLLLSEVTKHYALKPGQCWGYNYRPVRNGSALSFHAYGLALALNAPGERVQPDRRARGAVAHVRPGSRTVRKGSAGTDVQFVQWWLGIPATAASSRSPRRTSGRTRRCGASPWTAWSGRSPGTRCWGTERDRLACRDDPSDQRVV
jgi:hypothetical protein